MIRSIFGTGIRQVLSGGLQVVATWIVATQFGVTVNGEWAYVLAAAILGATALGFGIGPTVAFLVSRAPADWHKVIKYAIWFNMGIATLVVLVGLALLITGDFAEVGRSALIAIMLITPSLLMLNLLTGLEQGLSRFVRLNALLMVQPAVYVLLLAVGSQFIAYVDSALLVYWIMSAYSLAMSVSVLVGFCRLRREYKARWMSDFSGLNNIDGIVKYSSVTYLCDALAALNSRVDILMLSVALSPAQVGVFAVASSLAERVYILPNAVNMVLFPRLSAMGELSAQRLRLVLNAVALIVGAGLLITIAVALGAHAAVGKIFGQEYIEAAKVLVILMPGITAASISKILANDIAAFGRPLVNAVSTTVVIIGNVCLNLWLIPLYGIVGAAIATTVSLIINALFRIAWHVYSYRSTQARASGPA